MISISQDFKTSSEDAYSIKLSSYDDSFFSSKVYELLQKGDIEVVGIDLTRVRGEKPTSINDLMKLTNFIANIFLARQNVILAYYCDFLSSIPHTNKNITSQAYRSYLFSLLCTRYVKTHKIDGINEKILTIKGEEDYFVHIIYRKQHNSYVDIIADDIREGFDKP